jgi:D-3-phosphoglycerate dehydrogenase
MTMRVLIADKFGGNGVDALRAAGCDVVLDPGLNGQALRDAIVKTLCRILVVRSTEVTADMLQAGNTLCLVVRAGAGVNTIDVTAASQRAILVANCPGKNAIAVAELTFALILGLDRRVCENVVDLRNGRWNKREYAAARGLKGRTLGVVGLGRIGEAVVRRALAFEMDVVA